MKRPKDDIFYGDKEEYACLNWCQHLEMSVTLGGEDLLGLLEEVPLGGILKEFTSEWMDVWLNTSLLEGRAQLRSLRSATSKFKVGHMAWLFWG